MKYIIVIILVCAVALSGMAQTPLENVNNLLPKPIPQAPNVASLGRYGSYEVSYYTGLPDISVPIFEVKSGSLRVPITLRYHASGIRMSDDASWVGLGWSLSTGGQISRKVEGRPDEEYYTSNALLASLGNCTTYTYLRDCADEIYDPTPDIFSYSFGGKSGNFIIGKTGDPGPFLFPYQPIDFTVSDLAGSDFRVLDNDGTEYRFGRNAAGILSRDYTSTYAGGVSKGAYTAWHLMEINAPNSNDKIRYSYQSQGVAVKSDVTDVVVVMDNCNGLMGGDCGIVGISTETTLSSFSIGGEVPSEIIFEGGKVQFILGAARTDLAGLMPLDMIKVYSSVNSQYTLVKSFKFKYSYYTGESRLKLDELQELDNAGSLVNSYKFTYHSNSLTFGTYGKSIDYWGLYNGVGTNTDLIRQQTIDFNGSTTSIGHANRETDTTYTKQGVLTSIEFPTGGRTDFAFETHRYLDGSTVKFAGGLRVKRITSTPGMGQPTMTRTYQYGTSGNGYKNFSLNPNAFLTAQGFINHANMAPTALTTYTVRTYLASAMFGLSPLDGSLVVYPNVTEIVGDGSGNAGRTEYEYDAAQPPELDFTTVLPNGSNKSYTNAKQWLRGNLTSTKVYDKDGNLLSKTEKTYLLLKSSSKFIGTLVSAMRIWVNIYAPQIFGPWCFDSGYNGPVDPIQYTHQHYSQATGIMLEDSVNETIYEKGNPSRMLRKKTKNSYHADYVQLLSTTEKLFSKSESGLASDLLLVSTSRFPFQCTFPSSGETDNVKALRLMKERNIRTVPFEHYVTRSDGNASNDKVISGQLTTFKENPNAPGQAVAEEIFIIEDVSGVSGYAPATTSSGAVVKNAKYKSRIKFGSYDRFGNIEEVNKTDDVVTSYLWGYNSDLPVAEIKGSGLGRTATNFSYSHGATIVAINQSSDVALSPTLTIDYPQTITYKMNFYKVSGTPTTEPSLDVVLKKSDGSVAFDPSAYFFGVYTASFALEPGTYTLYYRGQAHSSTITFIATLDCTTTSVKPKAFYTSFEETGISNTTAFTGSRVNIGSYTIKLPTAAGKYRLTWFQKNSGGDWGFQSQLITDPAGATLIVGSGAQYIDEVRLFPENAQMTTYTYDPLLGTTCVSDANSVRTFYEYDTSGRLKLIRDDQGRILKTYQYHFQGQE